MEQNEIRELLELAAKAAGYKILGDWEYDESWGFKVSTGPGAPAWWNPYADDGDSRRLEVALKLHILHNDRDEEVLWVSAVVSKTATCAAVEFADESERAAATRLAALRCAAEIGRRRP